MAGRGRRPITLLLGLALVLTGCTVVSPPPAARFDVEPPVLYAGESIVFDASSSTSDTAIVDYNWDLGDGKSASGRKITATFASAGSYAVTLTIEDASGRLSTITHAITVYVRGGTQLFREDFSAGSEAIWDWALDPTWASAYDSQIEYIAGTPGYCLYVHSGGDRWHRRSARVTLPPLRIGQRLVFACNAMTLQNQDSHTFLIAPGRRQIASATGSLPFFEFTSDGGGSYVREPTSYGEGVRHPVPFTPQIYRWHTYSFAYSADGYELWVDGTLWETGPHTVDLSEGADWFILLGEESSTEACSVYYDDIRVSVEE